MRHAKLVLAAYRLLTLLVTPALGLGLVLLFFRLWLASGILIGVGLALLPLLVIVGRRLEPLNVEVEVERTLGWW